MYKIDVYDKLNQTLSVTTESMDQNEIVILGSNRPQKDMPQNSLWRAVKQLKIEQNNNSIIYLHIYTNSSTSFYIRYYIGEKFMHDLFANKLATDIIHSGTSK